MPRKNPKSGTQVGQAVKWPTSEQRKAACESFCKHVSSGYSQDNWPEADFETVKRYERDFPEDFCPEKIARAKREASLFYEKSGVLGMLGKIPNFNAKAWAMQMQNRNGWSTHNTTKNIDLKPPTIVDSITDADVIEGEVVDSYTDLEVIEDSSEPQK